MTNEVKNVVEILKDLITCKDLRMNKCDYTCVFYNNPLVVCQQDKALGFAIQSLESQEGDLINREDAIGVILKYYTECERTEKLSFTPNLIKQKCADLLSELPPVTPQPYKAESEDAE